MALNKILFIENDSQLAAGLMQILSAFWHVDLIQDSKELANYYVKNGPVLAAVMVDAGQEMRSMSASVRQYSL